MLAKKNVLLSFSLIPGRILLPPLYGQAAPAADGIYSADQAHRGEDLYKKQCASCHGDRPGWRRPVSAAQRR